MTLAIFLTCFIGGLIIGPMALIFHIMAALAVNDGKKYEYPMTIRFIKVILRNLAEKSSKNCRRRGPVGGASSVMARTHHGSCGDARLRDYA